MVLHEIRMLLRKLVNERERKKAEVEGLKHRMKNLEYRLRDLKRRTCPHEDSD